MLRFDFSLYDRFGQLAALVDVRSGRGTSTEWAAKLRRNLLAHGEIPRVPFLLVATPEWIFLWRDAAAVDPLATPDYEADAEPLFRPYIPKSGPAASPRAINGQAFELVVQSWLSDLTRGEPESVSTALAESGLRTPFGWVGSGTKTRRESPPRMSTNTWQAQQDLIEATCRQLVDQQAIEPLSTDEEETKLWNLRELASLIEGNFHVQLDLTGLSEIERLAYERRASWDGGTLASPHSEYRHPFWLLAEGRRVGTLAVPTMISGRDLISVSSLYVDPAARRGNIARRALEAVFRAGLELGAGGIRLDTNWTWQPAVRFYARIGMWVRSWKHNLVFTWQVNLPPCRVEIGETEARFLIEQDGEWITKVTARNLGDRLGWEPTGLEPGLGEPFYCIPGTFALHLALAGWPLIRSDETWEHRHNWSDAGQPEGLAYKIEIFEAIDRGRGFDVRTPRIPGLEYRDL